VNKYEFSLIFDVAGAKLGPDECVESLGAHGCDDAIVGVGKAGRLALSFTRRSSSATDAVLSAIGDVRIAVPGAQLLEAAPDYVGITEAAAIVGRSRQNMRKLMLGSLPAAPAPLHEGSSAIWHLAVLLRWVRDEKRYRISGDLLELARTNMQVNLAVDQRNADAPVRAEIDALLA
jgi:hypothetical protein